MTSQPLLDPYGIHAAQEAAIHPPKRKPLYRRAWFWAVCAGVVLVIGVRVALNPVAEHFVRQGLAGIDGYHARLKSVEVSLIPLRMTIVELAIEQNDAAQTEPLVYVHHLVAQVLWRKLFKGEVVALASIQKAKFVITVGVSEVTPQMAEAARKTVEVVKKNDFNFAAILQKVIPLRVDRIELREGEFTLVDATDPKLPSFWVNDIELVVDNLVTRKTLDENAPLTLTMRAAVAKTGIIKVLATADLLSEKPAFTGEAQLTGLRLESLYEWTASKLGLSATGNFDVFANFNSAAGKLSGDVKVVVREAKVMPAKKDFGDEVKSRLANVAIKVLSDRVEGREAVATTLPIRGTLNSVDAQVWPTILGVVRNAFVEGLDWGFSDLPKPTSEKKEGVIGQAVQALDKNSSAPKAQPAGGTK
jgi:hypothetical protein